MRKKDLEIKLERVKSFENPSAILEQYSTPARIASDILFSAYANGDVLYKTINDLGCGTGIFAIGAKLLNADIVRGYDVSSSAITLAMNNAKMLGVGIKFMVCDVLCVNDKSDTTFMNPPFGCQNEHADRSFLDTAMKLSKSIYSIHMASTKNFITSYVESFGREVVAYTTYKYNIPHTFPFHTRSRQVIDIVAVNIR
ncbi:MAG: METTL5 family protein [archaeon]|nr:METTL5 family protein [archaeon]